MNISDFKFLSSETSEIVIYSKQITIPMSGADNKTGTIDTSSVGKRMLLFAACSVDGTNYSPIEAPNYRTPDPGDFFVPDADVTLQSFNNYIRYNIITRDVVANVYLRMVGVKP